MEQGTVTVIIAFFAGVVSFFSPCQLPLFPVYLGFLTGTVLGGDGRPARRKAVINSLHFVAGFSLVFILLGVIASWFAGFFADYRILLQRLAGLVIIFFGLHLSGIFSPAAFLRERRITVRADGTGGAMLMGIAFAAGWTPCIGPVLGTILAVTAVTGGGVLLLAAFSLGMAVPFLAAALLVGQAATLTDRFTACLPLLQRIMGVLMIILGLAVFSGMLTRLAVF